MDHNMDDAPAIHQSAMPAAQTANDSEVSTTLIPRRHPRLRPINCTMDDTPRTNDSKTSPPPPLPPTPMNRRRKLSSSSSEDDQSSSQVDEIYKKPQKVTDFKVRVVERVVEREVVPAHVTQQLAERDEWIVQLQCELEAEKTGKATSKDDSNVPQSSQAVSFTEVERRKLRGDIIDKARTIESLTNLNEKLQHCLVDSRRDLAALDEELKNTKQNSDSLTEELKESKETHSSASLEAANQLQKRDEEIERLQKELEHHRRIAVQDSTAKDPKTESLLTKLRNAESGIEEKMGQLSQFKRQVKYLEGNIATNDIHSQELNAAMQALKTGNAQLEAAVATAEKKLGDQYNVQNAEILDLKQKVHDLDASIVAKDLFSQNLSSDIKALETENANLNAVAKAAQNEFEERFATKEMQASALRNTIQALEEEKRKLEETAALEKPEVEADREAFKNLRETTEVLEQTLKELQDNLASKNSLINSLNTDLQRLETEKSKIAATAAAADKGHFHCWEDSIPVEGAVQESPRRIRLVVPPGRSMAASTSTPALPRAIPSSMEVSVRDEPMQGPSGLVQLAAAAEVQSGVVQRFVSPSPVTSRIKGTGFDPLPSNMPPTSHSSLVPHCKTWVRIGLRVGLV
ncbi:hypothetical protein C8R41DRAFT_918582 [Lentinula lateritia]|uniref:Uncharacterized protein n=1 Tax=Lentinula lateritia TaxID=40482 RepID=A0ABQ8VJE0_9AGAR|nr:hypothetical protein C8R41DRAFT_918582 [Lentinula lateritia]